MWPKHANPTQKRVRRHEGARVEQRATAPYNFVPLPDAVKAVDPGSLPGHDEYGALTGRIEVALRTKTPIYTRTAFEPGFFEKWGDDAREALKDPQARQSYAQFFHLADAAQPVIPGSSLRGMVRAVAEIVGRAKVQWVTDEPLVYRAVGDSSMLGAIYRRELMWEEDGARKLRPKVRAGYMERRGSDWFIRPAQTRQGVSFARIPRAQVPAGLRPWKGCANADELWVRVGTYDYQPVQEGHRFVKWLPVTDQAGAIKAGYEQVVLVRTGDIPRKKREAVFFLPDGAADLIPVSDELARRYREQVSSRQESLLNDRQGALRNEQPVFYLLDEKGELVFFGHTMMFRLPYANTPLDLTPKELRDAETIDLAEAVFGRAPQGSGDRLGRAGRVYFGDARLDGEQGNVWWQDEPFAPQILSGPKPTTFQHYLTQQEPDDIGTDAERRRLDHYGGPYPHETVIRGTKVYWHRAVESVAQVREMGFDARSNAAWERDTQHTIMRPVRDGLEFRFTIRFENLLEHELGLLLWALEPGGATPEVAAPGREAPDYCHKLGMGKPLGLGSVKLRVEELWVEERGDRVARYKTLFAPRTEGAQPGEGEPLRWHAPGSPKSDEVAAYKAGFEQFMGAPGGRFAASPRVRMLLTLMDWANKPAREATRYMTIRNAERRNEFVDRPVLPDPLHIGDGLGGVGYVSEPRATANALPEAQAPPEEQVEPPHEEKPVDQQLVEKVLEKLGQQPGEAATRVEDAPVTPRTVEEMRPGVRIRATVERKQFNAVLFKTGVPRVTAKLPIAQPGEGDKYTVGEEHVLWVIRRRGNDVVLGSEPPK